MLFGLIQTIRNEQRIFSFRTFEKVHFWSRVFIISLVFHIRSGKKAGTPWPTDLYRPVPVKIERTKAQEKQNGSFRVI